MNKAARRFCKARWMILQTLAALGPSHGYAIAARLEQVSAGAIQLEMGTLYPGLVRLEQRGQVKAKWEQTESKRRARFYSLTPAGRQSLSREIGEWRRMASIMERLLADGGKA